MDGLLTKLTYRTCGLLVSLLILTCITASAQSTKVKGRVTDASDGHGIPFAAVYFKDTSIGVSTDMDGYYTIETRDPQAKILCTSILGYESKENIVKANGFNEINFALRIAENAIAAATVKPDNRYIRWILKQIDLNRDRNNPEKLDHYQCTIYNKMELDLTNPEENFKSRSFRKNFGFVFDYVDTSVISGQTYLPAMISETISRRYHSNEPSLDKEVIEATRISGMNDGNVLSQFTGGLHFKTNFYVNFINAFNVEIPSPISSTGELYYNYYLIDSTYTDNRKFYKIRFHPKKMISSPAFNGEMEIDSKDFGLKNIHVKLKKGGNVNWVRDLAIDVENCRIGDSVWFYKNNRIYVDFAINLSDSSKMTSYIGNRHMEYYYPSLTMPGKDIVEQDYNVIVKKDAWSKDKDYWTQARPYKLTEKEQNIYNLVDSVQNVPLYRDIYTIINTLATGYFEIGKIGLGPYSRVYSFNKIEGSRFQMGLRTTKSFSRKMRFTGYAAYGIKDNDWKGGASAEFMFGTQPTRKLTLNASHDLVQLGQGSSAYADANIFTSIFAKGGGGGLKRSIVNEFSVKYEHEISSNFSNMISLEHRRIHSNDYVPMFTPDSTSVPSIASNWIRYTARFSWDEDVTRGVFDKQYLYTKYPVITLDLIGSLNGLTSNDYRYLRSELSLDYRLATAPAGFARIHLNTGKIFGKVPYPILKLHEGNATYFLDKSAFACMNFYEFASDTWATLFYEHNFNGFFFNKIPLIRQLNLREVVTVKAAYGTLTKRNNGIIGSPYCRNAELLFPEGMSDLKKPYVEAGVGISNIFRVLRVDAFWRLTHRYNEVNGERKKADNRFALNVGFEFRF